MKRLNSATTTLCGVAVATVASFSIGVESANALFKVSGTSCSTDNFTLSADCEGIFGADPPDFSGNASNDIDISTELFGETGWKELFKVDMSGSTGMTDDLLTVTPDDSDLLSGTWSLGAGFDFGDYEDVMFTLKGGPTFSAYLSDGVSTSGTWNTNDLLKGNGDPNPGLSNFIVWGRDKETESVPEPATILGLGSIALASRFLRRKSDDV
jgi:hypothetical protein